MSDLTDRAHGRTAKKAVAKRDDNTLQGQIKAMEEQFALAMPKGLEAAQLVRDALTSIRQTPDLLKCNPQTVLGALMTCAQLGLRPGVLGHAWVLPFWDGRSQSHQAQLIVGYKGLVELAYRNPQVSSIIARTVYRGDVFEVDYGLEDNLVHKPNLEADRDEPIAHYAIFRTASGGRAFWVMTQAEAEAWREKYAPRNRQKKIVGPWTTDFEAMARKTCLIRLSSWMPKSTELAYAIEVDQGVRADARPDAELADVTVHVEQVADEPSDDGPAADPETGEVRS